MMHMYKKAPLPKSATSFSQEHDMRFPIPPEKGIELQHDYDE